MNGYVVQEMCPILVLFSCVLAMEETKAIFENMGIDKSPIKVTQILKLMVIFLRFRYE